jgi:acyl-CoA synthetase (AMP-forming)/AMP-acid ligase II
MTGGVGSWIERRARIQPERIALAWGEERITYGDLAGRIRRLGHAFSSFGIGRGDRIGWLGPNHPAFLETLFAASSLGAALAPVNHRLDQEAMAAQLEDASPTVLVTTGAPPGQALPSSVQTVVTVGPTPGATGDFDDLVAGAVEDPIRDVVSHDDVCLIPYTSGTTGPSKGVMLTHGNVTWNVINWLTRADFRNDDVTLAVTPFFRTGGTGVNVLPVLFMGGTVVVPEAMEPDLVLRLMERHRATVGFANPDLVEALTSSSLWATTDLSTVRFIVTGGAPVPERLIRACLERGLNLVQGYGLSEAGPLVLVLDPASALRKVGAAGKPALFVDIRIVHADGLDALPGETGELLVRGPNVMAGYLNRPEATRATVDEDGWLHTGDAVRLDEDGDVWIVDRLQAGFPVGGRMVYPGDVERVLLDHPAIADAAVAGAPVQNKDTVVAAYVVLAQGATATEAEIRASSAERLPADVVPQSVMFVDRLPRNSVGKLLRAELHGLSRPSEGKSDR